MPSGLRIMQLSLELVNLIAPSNQIKIVTGVGCQYQAALLQPHFCLNKRMNNLEVNLPEFRLPFYFCRDTRAHLYPPLSVETYTQFLGRKSHTVQHNHQKKSNCNSVTV